MLFYIKKAFCYALTATIMQSECNIFLCTSITTEILRVWAGTLDFLNGVFDCGNVIICSLAISSPFIDTRAFYKMEGDTNWLLELLQELPSHCTIIYGAYTIFLHEVKLVRLKIYIF